MDNPINEMTSTELVDAQQSALYDCDYDLANEIEARLHYLLYLKHHHENI